MGDNDHPTAIDSSTDSGASSGSGSQAPSVANSLTVPTDGRSLPRVEQQRRREHCLRIMAQWMVRNPTLTAKAMVPMLARLDPPVILSHMQVSRYVKIVRARWQEETQRDIDEIRGNQLAELRQLRSTAWEAFQRSQQPAEVETVSNKVRHVKVTRRGRDGVEEEVVEAQPYQEITRVMKGQAGDRTFLSEIRQIIELEATLQGTKIEIHKHEHAHAHFDAQALMGLMEDTFDDKTTLVIDADVVEAHVEAAKLEDAQKQVEKQVEQAND